MKVLIVCLIILLLAWTAYVRRRRIPDSLKMLAAIGRFATFPRLNAGSHVLMEEIQSLRRLTLTELVALRGQAMWLNRFHRSIIGETGLEDVASQMIARRMIALTLCLVMVYVERVLCSLWQVRSAFFERLAISLYWDMVEVVRMTTTELRPDLMAIVEPVL